MQKLFPPPPLRASKEQVEYQKQVRSEPANPHSQTAKPSSTGTSASASAQDPLVVESIACSEKLQQLATCAQESKYDVALVDPPWAYRGRSAHLAGTTPYSTMSPAALAALPVSKIMANNAVLFLWATAPMLDQAVKLFSAWGFTYKTVFFVWIKRYRDNQPVSGLGHWTRGCTEYCLVGTRGTTLTRWRSESSRTVQQLVDDGDWTLDNPLDIESERTRHSQKPEICRDLIEDFFPDRRRIELFSRQIVPNWSSWGLDIPHYYAEPSAGFGNDNFDKNHLCAKNQRRDTYHQDTIARISAAAAGLGSLEEKESKRKRQRTENNILVNENLHHAKAIESRWQESSQKPETQSILELLDAF